MTLYRVQAQIKLDSDLHTASNTFHFSGMAGDATIPAEVTEAIARVRLFYTELARTGSINGTQVLAGHVCQTSGLRLKVYNMSDPEPRVPVADETSTITGGSTVDGQPWEVSLVLSYRRDYVSGTANARRRGRLFLGPITTIAKSTYVSGIDPPPTGTTIQRMLAAGQLLAVQIVTPLAWVQFSPTEGAYAPVTEISVDNSFDTMRARGMKPNTRTEQPVP